MKSLIASMTALTAVLSLSGCTLPNGGPLAGTVQDTPSVPVVSVTPALARQMVLASRARQQATLDASLAALSHPAPLRDYHLCSGDNIQIALWTFSPWPGQSSSSSPNGTGGPAPIPLGTFQLDTHGDVTLPYANRVHLAGMTAASAEQTINHRYETLHILQSPSSSVTISGGARDSILVTGAIGKPSLLPWNPAGVTMAEALTQAMSDGASISPQTNASPGQQTATTVTVYRDRQLPVSLPIASALENSITLQPGDKLIVQSKPVVQTTVLGGGVMRAGGYGFGETPSLAQVLAQAQGLNPNAANAQHIFIFRQNLKMSPVLYDFNFNSGTGILTAQTFPIEDQDIIYVAESPIIPVSRVLNTIFQMALPATIAR